MKIQERYLKDGILHNTAVVSWVELTITSIHSGLGLGSATGGSGCVGL